jgi:hypothetical protein
MSLYRTFSQGDAESSGDVACPEGAPRQPGWIDHYLPPAGFERKAFLFLAALVFALKVLTIYHYRADPDETQHAYVVWGWVNGHMQYRDRFDNHMPLFQMAYSPIMRLIGERADIIIWLRWTMLPLFLFCLGCVFELTEILFSRRIAPWLAMAAAALPKFFYTSTEFRPDNLWAAFWLLALLAAVSGKFTFKRALGFGLFLGLTFAVSMKTVVLLAALLTATIIALLISWIRRDGPNPLRVAANLPVILVAMVIPTALIAWYFYANGAIQPFLYGVVWHNIVPRMKRWGHFSVHEWIFPISVAVLAVYAWFIFHQARDSRLAIRRTIILLTPWLFLCLLLSYWPDITREDDLPYTPLTPLLAVPVVIWLASRFKFPRLKARFFTWVLPAVCFIELICVWNANTLRTDRLKVTTRSIRDVLLITGPNDYVMDALGNYVFRQRPDYWVFETITKVRLRLGLIKDDVIGKLEKTETKMCYLLATRVQPKTSLFMLANYISFDPEALDLGVAGKNLGAPSADGTYNFDVVIPQTYAVVSESGATAGLLDGAAYTGPVRLGAGHHTFHRTSGSGRVAIFLARAEEAGFQPLFDAEPKLAKLVKFKDD